MSALEITSDIFRVDSRISSVYLFLSDFNRIKWMYTKVLEMGNGLFDIDGVAGKVDKFQTTADTLAFTLQNAGDVCLRITEREEPKLIKIVSGGNIPLNATLWIQLLEQSPYDTRLKITFRSDMSMMLRMMLKGKLEKGISHMAEELSKIPYMLLELKYYNENNRLS